MVQIIFLLFMLLLPIKVEAINPFVFDLNKTINECSNAFLSVTFVDSVGNTVTPDVIDWYVDDITTGNRLTDIYTCPTRCSGSGANRTFNIPTFAHRILFENNWLEKRLLTINYEYGSEDYRGTSFFRYQVRNSQSIFCTSSSGPTPVATPTNTNTRTPTRTFTPSLTPTP